MGELVNEDVLLRVAVSAQVEQVFLPATDGRPAPRDRAPVGPERGASMTTTAVEFDPFSDEYFNDPTEVYRRLREATS